MDEAALIMHRRGDTYEAKAVKALKMTGSFFQDTIGKHERV